MKTKIKTFNNEEEVNKFLNEQLHINKLRKLTREYVDLQVVNFQYPIMLFILVYKTNEDDFENELQEKQ